MKTPNSINIKYTCKKCEHDFQVDVTFPTPAQTYGPPEKCYPAESGEVSPDECEECGTEVDYDTALEAAASYIDALKDYYYEKKEEEWREYCEENKIRHRWEED